MGGAGGGETCVNLSGSLLFLMPLLQTKYKDVSHSVLKTNAPSHVLSFNNKTEFSAYKSSNSPGKLCIKRFQQFVLKPL